MEIAEAESALWERLNSMSGSGNTNASFFEPRKKTNSPNNQHRWSLLRGNRETSSSTTIITTTSNTNTNSSGDSGAVDGSGEEEEVRKRKRMKEVSMKMLYGAYGKRSTLVAAGLTAANTTSSFSSSSATDTSTTSSCVSAQEIHEEKDDIIDPLLASLTLYNTVGPIPTFAKPKAEVSLLAPEAFIGARVKVEWPGDDWYPGIVDRYDKETGRHHVFYDDGDTRW